MNAEAPIQPALPRRILSEFLGTGLLVAVVVGSGIAASRLSPDDVGLQLLENSIATALGLGVLIAVLAPISGAHFNPVVTLALLALAPRGHRDAVPSVAYVVAQIAGAIGGAVLANAMFGVPTAIATTERAWPGALLGEVVATAGLVLVIVLLVAADRAALVPLAVAAWIGSAYWFTSSTSFANPAVTIGRVFSDTFAGVAPASVAPFIAAQLLGAALGVAIAVALGATARSAAAALPTTQHP